MRFGNIKLVVFDIAGTTVVDKGNIALAFQTALHDNGYQVPVEKINPLMGYQKPQAIRMMLDEHEPDAGKVTPELVDIIHNRFLQLMIEYYNSTPDLHPQPGAEELLGLLKEEGVQTALDTGFSSNITEVIMRRLGWKEKKLVDHVVSSDEVKAGRPHPYMIEKIMQQAGISDPQQVVKIGDTEVDVNEGKNAGCRYSIAVTTGAFSRAELEPYAPSYIIDNLEALIPILEQ